MKATVKVNGVDVYTTEYIDYASKMMYETYFPHLHNATHCWQREKRQSFFR